jgi:hypothetical protein
MVYGMRESTRDSSYYGHEMCDGENISDLQNYGDDTPWLTPFGGKFTMVVLDECIRARKIHDDVLATCRMGSHPIVSYGSHEDGETYS